MAPSRASVAALLGLGVTALALLAPRPAAADIPYPSASVFDSCLVWCPAGDAVYHMQVNHIGGRPFPSPTCTWDITTCPGVHPCPLDGSEPYFVYDVPPNRFVRWFGDNFGVANVAVRSGGTCTAASLFVDGVFFITLPVVSPDLNGDGFVDGSDRGILLSLMGSSEPAADFNCDGTVDNADLNILMQHFGHACAGGATPTHQSTWGEVKTIYR